MAHDNLFEPLKMGTQTLKNRIIMAPLTRLRAIEPGDVPTALASEYYSQRAGAGLVITEATQVLFKLRAMLARQVFIPKIRPQHGKPSSTTSMPRVARSSHSYGILALLRTKAYSLTVKPLSLHQTSKSVLVPLFAIAMTKRFVSKRRRRAQRLLMRLSKWLLTSPMRPNVRKRQVLMV